MPKLNLTLNTGEDEDGLPISDREAQALKAGFNSGSPFSFTDDDGAWVWFNPDSFAGVSIEED